MLTTTTTMLGPINSTAYFPWLVILEVVIHAHMRLVESLKAKAKEKVEEATTSMLRSKTNKEKNHFDFFSSPKQKSCILDYNLEDQHHQRNITQLMSYVRLPWLPIQLWSTGIPITGRFILESTVGPTNTTHQLSNIYEWP